MNSDLQVVWESAGEVGFALSLPEALIEHIRTHPDLRTMRVTFEMDNERALLLASDIRRAAEL